MRQAGQTVIDALRGKGRQRGRAIGVMGAGAVDDIVVGGGQIRHVKDIAQRKLQHALLRHRNSRIARHREMHRDRRGRHPDLHRHRMVLHQQFQLLNQVVAEQIRSGDRGGIGAGAGDMAKGKPAVGLDVADHRKPDLGVKGTNAGGGFRTLHHGAEMFGKELGGLSVKRFKAVDRKGGIGENFGFRVVWSPDDCWFVVHVLFFSILIGHVRGKRAISQVKS